MPGSRKRAPSTPKRTPKRPKTKKSQGKQRELPGGALELSFQLDGMCSLLEWCVHELILWLASSTAAQASSGSHHVHFDVGSTSAAPGAPPGPSGQHLEGEDPFRVSTPAQPSNQVSIYYINLTIYF